MKIPYYLFASALCLALTIGACSDGPTEVADEAALSASSDVASAKKPDENGKHKVDICHWDADGHDEVAPDDDGDGAWFQISVDERAWNEKTFDETYDGCGAKGNGRKATGHNGHEMDKNYTGDEPDECNIYCAPDSDGDGWDDDVDNCVDDYNPDQTNTDGLDDGGDACDDDDDEDGVDDGDDNCPLTPNPGQEDEDSDGFGAACECDDDNPDVNPDATEVCNGVDDNCSGVVDDGGACDGPAACDHPEACPSAEGCGDGDTCEPSEASGSYCFFDADNGGGGLCVGNYFCANAEAIDCDTGSECASGVCLASTCCGSSKAGTCMPTGALCDTVSPPEASGDIVPRLFKSQGATAAGQQ